MKFCSQPITDSRVPQFLFTCKLTGGKNMGQKALSNCAVLTKKESGTK